jgi:uncharacterized damage-inducible protein DinB
MTVDTPLLLARFNAHANTEMHKVLSQLPAGDWARDLGGYYSSFRSVLGHLYTTDIAWLVRFTSLRPFEALKGDPFSFPPAPGHIAFDTYAEYLEMRRTLDSSIVSFAQELTGGDLEADLSYRNFRGETLTKNFGGLVLHLFNHQTHHRGMVALYLDQLDVPNDFNGISGFL